MSKYFLIAGEASGDQHAAALIEQIRLRDPEAEMTGFGGDRMVAAGCRLYQDYRKMAFMGFAAVLKNIGQIRRNFRMAEQALIAEKPDVLILIDYPSFNLRMAEFCRKQLSATKIYYYIPPKVWAWKKWRIHRLSRLCDEVLGIFPFEPEFYAKYGYKCTYVGNPTAERIQSTNTIVAADKIAILPGSRLSEVTNCLPRMLEAARRFSECEIVVCAAPGIDKNVYKSSMHDGEKLTHDTYDAVRNARAAIVNSGTATLETALLGCPQVAVYHLALNGLVKVIRPVVQGIMFDIPYFTLVNIIAGKQVIRELLANDFTTDAVAAELQRLLTDKQYKRDMLAEYEHIRSILGSSSASTEAAKIICGH